MSFAAPTLPDATPTANATAACTLRRAHPDDAPAFVRMMEAPEVFANVLQVPYPDQAFWRKRLEDQQLKPGSTDIHLVALVDGEMVGSAGLHAASWAVRRRHAMSLGITVARQWHGRGIGSALMAALCRHADDWAGVLRLELTVFADNAAAIGLYRKFGFETEGLLRAYALRDGQYVDTLSMARLHPSPPHWPRLA